MNKVWNNIWIGNIYEALKHGSDFQAILCVAENNEIGEYERQMLFSHRKTILIFSHFMVAERDEAGKYVDYYADPVKLEQTLEIISMLDSMGIKTLLHCAAGMERSPLAMIWYLYRYAKCWAIEDAYKLVKEKHPHTENRLTWLKKLIPQPFSE